MEGLVSELVYQVFVDRFRAFGSIPAMPERASAEGTIRRSWDLAPAQPPRGIDLYGGNLDGVRASLPHLRELGVDTLYLTPIFRAPSNHKYDAADYFEVDEQFGGDAAFERLVRDTREHGLGLVLDGVFNHVGERHAWLTERPALFRQTNWRGHGHLREIDLQHPDAREAIVGPAGVVRHWIDRGATGWRLDCANDLGPEICRLIADAARQAGARDGTIGELMAYPAKSAHHDFGGLDGVMNYWIRSCALELASGQAPAAQIQHVLDRLAGELPLESLLRSWSILSSHDTPRIASVLEGRARIEQALALQFAYPGTPMIYYGEEIGMVGGADPANRAGMIWDEARWDRERFSFLKKLCLLRKREPALRLGRYLSMPQPGTDLVVFARVTERPSDTILFVANASAAARRSRIFLPLASLFDALPLRDLVGDAPHHVMEQGCLTVDLPGHGYALLKVADDHASGYRFFK